MINLHFVLAFATVWTKNDNGVYAYVYVYVCIWCVYVYVYVYVFAINSKGLTWIGGICFHQLQILIQDMILEKHMLSVHLQMSHLMPQRNSNCFHDESIHCHTGYHL